MPFAPECLSPRPTFPQSTPQPCPLAAGLHPTLPSRSSRFAPHARATHRRAKFGEEQWGRVQEANVMVLTRVASFGATLVPADVGNTSHSKRSVALN